MTAYVVLGQYENEWTTAGIFEARSAQSAIRSCLENGDLPARIKMTDHYVAVPARSWQPVQVTTETKTQLRFS